MKKNLFRNKLDLNKQTIAHLNDNEMRRIRGGSYPETRDHVNTSKPVPSCCPCPLSEPSLDITQTVP